MALGEDDAAGEGLAAGLGLFVVVVTVALGEGDVDAVGLAAFGVFASLTGSVAQPAANAMEAIVRSRIAVRLIMLMFGVLISFCLVPARLKSRMMIAQSPIRSNGRSHRRFVGTSARSAPKPSFSKSACTINERESARGNEPRISLLSQQRVGVDVCTFPVPLRIGDDGD